MEGNMATNKAKRPVLLAQQRHSLNHNPRQILRPKNGLRISPAGSQPPKTRLHARKAAQPAELMPVRAHVYRTMADVNGGLEHAIEGLQTLQKINYLRSDGLNAIHDLICRTRAQANRELIAVLNDRETVNLGHFDQLCIEHEKTRPAANS